MDNDEMNVIKRDGSKVEMSFDKILHRIKRIGEEENIKINFSALVMKIFDQLHNDISTTQIDELMAEQCASQSTLHTDYGILASRLIVSNYHKNTEPLFSNVMNQLYNFNDVNGVSVPMINDKVHNIILEHGEVLDKMIDHTRDNLLDYFGFKTLERAYLFKINKKSVERPQHMWLRVALAIHGENFDDVKETYDLMSQKYFTHATPTLYNAGTPRSQLSSCYLIAMEDDSIDGIYNTLKDCANISKYAGGIGLHIHNVRAAGSHIRGTNGTSNGVVPMLRVFNNTARYVDQGGGKRNGSFAIYLEPWHADLYNFLDMRRNQGDEEMKGRDLFYALWIPDLFMKRIQEDGYWTFMCPDECPGLSDVYGDEFEKLYIKYENEQKGRHRILAREVWFRVLDSQMETGTPYLLYKDACNSKSNQKNLGTIKSSNLCTEIVEYSDANETAVCNLASIGLSAFVDNKTKEFDYIKLHYITKVITKNLNNVIDINFYPTDKTKESNLKHRPIGIGVQGLADVFALMDICFDSEEACEVNKQIFETIYHGALECSCELACVDGAYASFNGSPASEGILQFDMWNVQPSSRYDWDNLKTKIKECGLRNSLLLAPMPTASTAQILGNNECFEPFTSNIYSRRTLAGEFMIVNKHLMRDLIDLKLWNESVKNNIIANKGSVQQILHIPEHIRNKYKIVWEISMKQVINMARDRGAFICQSQSMNLWQEDPTYSSLTSMHFYAWKQGLKTGMYYLRRKAKHQAQQFTIEPSKTNSNENENENEICEMCSG
jgi:ribonucleoside-diphosphate reductase alpha subunit